MSETYQEIYVLLPNSQTEWEDILLFLNKDDAIEACKKRTDWRVEIFRPYCPHTPKLDKGAFYPTYDTL